MAHSNKQKFLQQKQQAKRTCPVCEQEFDQLAIIEPGMTWADVYPGTPSDFARKFQRTCTSSLNARTGEAVHRGIAFYTHER